MSTQLQLRRGTTAQHSTFTGASGEITIDTDKKTVVVHDGTTAGGRALPQFDSSGNMLVGTTNINPGIEGVQGSSINIGYLTVCRKAPVIYAAHLETGNLQEFRANGTTFVGSISVGTATTSYNTSSDYRLKEDYRPVADAIDRLNQLKPINFAWKVDGSRCDGFLAHELQEVIPEAATGHKDETRTEEYEVTPKVEATFDEEGNELTPAVEAVIGEREVPVYQGIDQSKIVPLLTAALQEAVAKIESLTHRIEALEYTKQGE